MKRFPVILGFLLGVAFIVLTASQLKYNPVTGRLDLVHSYYELTGEYRADHYGTIDNALSVLPNNSVLKLKKGTYSTSGLTKSADDITIRGEKSETTIIYLADNSNTDVLSIGGKNWILENLLLDGNSGNNTGSYLSGIEVIGRDSLTVRNCIIRNCEDYGIRFHADSDNALIENTMIHDCGRLIGATCFGGSGNDNIRIIKCNFHSALSGSMIDVTADTKYYNKDWFVDQCSFTGGTGYMGILFDSCINAVVTNSYFNVGAAVNGDAANIRYYAGATGLINGCVFDGAGAGEEYCNVSLYGAQYVSVTSNIFRNIDGSDGNGLHIESQMNNISVSNITVGNNTFYNISTDAAKAAVQLYAAASHVIENVTFTGNVIIDDRGASSYCHYGFFIPSSSTGTVRDVVFSANTIKGCLNQGFRLDGINENLTISANNLNDLPYGLYSREGDQMMIINNRFDACTTPIDVNGAGQVRPLIMGNSWDGCTNDASTGSATNPRITANIDKNGAWWTTGDAPN